MDYRGKHYTIIQGIGPNSWKWKSTLDDTTVKPGTAKMREMPKTIAVWTIDKALAPEKVKRKPRPN